MLYRVQFYVPSDFSNPQAVFDYISDDKVSIWLNETPVVSQIGGSQGVKELSNDETVNGALQPGLNEIKMLVFDTGGLAGLNFKITIQVDAATPPTVVDNTVDTTPPTTPSLSADIANPTAGPVTVTVDDWGDAVIREYRVDGGEWQSPADASTIVMTANGTVEARGTDSAGNESDIGSITVANIVADEDPLQVTVAAMNANGEDVTVQFNHVLDLGMSPNIDQFHLHGTDRTIDSVRYVSDRAIVLGLSSSDAVSIVSNESQPLTLDVDYGAVAEQAGGSILEWRAIPVASQSEAIALRDALQLSSGGNSNGSIRIDNVVDYIRQSSADVTGDSIFDRNDVLYLLLQVDSLTAADMPASE